MCKWYCTSVGPSTDLMCLHCRAHYCAACLHGDGGKMESLVKCASCGKKPRVQPKESRGSWKGESTSGSTAAGPAYTPSAALKKASTAAASSSASAIAGGSGSRSPAKSPSKAAAAAGGSIFDKLTDASLYTGTHQHRFDADGRGRGLEGRDTAPKGHGLAPKPRAAPGANVELSSILRPETKDYTPAMSPPRRSPSSSPKKSGPSIFDKLTDSSQYTGSHKARFDSSGNGRGMSGRDAASGIEYGGGAKISSLSQITRTNLR